MNKFGIKCLAECVRLSSLKRIGLADGEGKNDGGERKGSFVALASRLGGWGHASVTLRAATLIECNASCATMLRRRGVCTANRTCMWWLASQDKKGKRGQ